jgi:hypothetical protein
MQKLFMFFGWDVFNDERKNTGEGGRRGLD